MEPIFDEICEEREYQIDAGIADFDSANTLNDWVAYITKYAGKAVIDEDYGMFKSMRHRLVQVAALAVAAIEACDENVGFPNHE